MFTPPPRPRQGVGGAGAQPRWAPHQRTGFPDNKARKPGKVLERPAQLPFNGVTPLCWFFTSAGSVRLQAGFPAGVTPAHPCSSRLQRRRSPATPHPCCLDPLLAPGCTEITLCLSQVHSHCLQTCSFDGLVYTILRSSLKRHRKQAADVLPQNASNGPPNGRVSLASSEEEGQSLRRGLSGVLLREGWKRTDQSCSASQLVCTP